MHCPPLHPEFIQQLRGAADCHVLVRTPDGVSFTFPTADLQRFREAYQRGYMGTLALPTRLIAYYDYVSPFAYLATKLMEILEAEYDVYVEWRGLELRPDWVEFPDWWFTSEASQARWEERREAVRRYGLPMQETRPKFRPRTRPLLMAGEYAKSRGRFRQFQRSVYEAYYGHGEDIRDLGVVKRLAEAIGLDGTELICAVMERTFEARIEEWRRAAEADQIFGVPTFKVGSEIIWGREPLDELRKSLDRVGASRRSHTGAG